MGFLDEKKKSNEEIKKSYEEVKKSYDDMKEVYERLGQKVDRLTVAIEKVAAPSFKQTIESRDRQLLEDVTRQMQNISDELESKTEGLRIVNKNHHTVIYTVFGVAVVIALSCFYMMYEMRQEVKATNEKYDLITSILSGDSHYWFNGENYTIGRESPTGEYFQKVYNDYQEKKQQQQQQKQN